jgi:hypothetical protein
MLLVVENPEKIRGIPAGRTDRKPDQTKGTEQEYDPMEMFRQRHTLRKQSVSGNSEVFQKDGPTSNLVQNSRRSVIQPNNLQSNYSVPVANSFNTLGN